MQTVNPEALLETPRLLLEPLQPAHALALYEPLQALAIYTFLPEDPPASQEVLATRYEQLASRMSPDHKEVWLNWAMRLRTEEMYVGILQTTIYPEATADLAYLMFPPFWRQGYAREGCRRIVDLLFKDYQIHTLRAEIDTRNEASLRVIESLGFRRVATKLHADFFKGAPSHEYQYKLRSPHQAG